jgi:hypothetical protein
MTDLDLMDGVSVVTVLSWALVALGRTSDLISYSSCSS